MKVFQYVALLSAGFLLVQCDKSDPEVVRFDDSYSVTKPNAGTRDQAPATNLLDLYGAFSSREVSNSVQVVGEADSRTVTSSPIAIKVETSFVTKSDVSFKLAYDEEKGATSGKVLIPASALTVPESVIIATGSLEATANVTISEEYLKTLVAGEYSFYLKLSTEDSNVAGLRSERDQVLVNVVVSQGQAPQPPTPQPTDPTEPTAFRTGYTFVSDYESAHLWKLTDMTTDGQPNTGAESNWWIDVSNEDLMLRADFTALQAIRGIHITCKTPSKRLGSVAVYTRSSDDEMWSEGGQYDLQYDAQGNAYIRFSDPVSVKSVLFAYMTGTNDDQQYADIHDLEFYR